MQSAHAGGGSGQPWLLLCVFAGLAAFYSVVTPIFETPDELQHYAVVKYIADGHGLPVLGTSVAGEAYRQEGSQPPLYYLLAAGLTRWIDTSDFLEVARPNPHVNLGVIAPSGNANFVVHRAGARESFPWSGTVLAVHVARGLSVLLGLVTVAATYRLGRELLPDDARTARLAAGLVAFLPMFVFLSGSVNNDNLCNAATAVLLVQIVRLARRQTLPARREYVLLGITTAVAMLAKFQGALLLAFVAAALALVSRRLRRRRPLLEGLCIAGGVALVLAGWWYARNMYLYGELTGIGAHLALVGTRPVPAGLRQIWTERESLARTFVGLFGWVNVMLPPWAYVASNLLALAGACGLAVRVAARRREPWPAGHLLIAAWPPVVFAAFLGWTLRTQATQGRLLFVALPPLVLGIAAGWSLLAGRARRPWLAAVPVAVLALLSAVYAPLAILEAYTPPAAITPSAPLRATYAEPGSDQPLLAIYSASLPITVTAGTYYEFDVEMELLRPATRSWSAFVHLTGAGEIILAQQDTYPGRGLLALDDLPAGRAWRNHFAVYVPLAACAPLTATVHLGFYDREDGTRLTAQGASADPIGRAALGEVYLAPAPGEYPNASDVDFGNALLLRGYTCGTRALAAGDSTTLTFYWEAARRLDADYTISVQLLDGARQVKAAQVDAPPALSTRDWVPGRVVSDTRTLAISRGTPPGMYFVHLVVYRFRPDGTIEVAPALTGIGDQESAARMLFPIRVLPGG